MENKQILDNKTCPGCNKVMKGVIYDFPDYLRCYDCCYKEMNEKEYMNCEKCNKKIHKQFSSEHLTQHLCSRMEYNRRQHLRMLLDRRIFCYDCSMECTDLILEKFH